MLHQMKWPPKIYEANDAQNWKGKNEKRTRRSNVFKCKCLIKLRLSFHTVGKAIKQKWKHSAKTHTSGWNLCNEKENFVYVQLKAKCVFSFLFLLFFLSLSSSVFNRLSIHFINYYLKSDSLPERHHNYDCLNTSNRRYFFPFLLYALVTRKMNQNSM